MYEKVKHAGISLSDWQKIFSNQFTLGELYQMHIGEMPWPKGHALSSDFNEILVAKA